MILQSTQDGILSKNRYENRRVCPDSEEEIQKAAFDCLRRIELTKKVRLIGVRVSHLKKVGEANAATLPSG